MYEAIVPLNQFISSMALALPRILVCFLIVPVLSGRYLKGILRIGVALGISLPVSVSIFHDTSIQAMDWYEILGLYGKEAIIGLLVGFFLALPFWLFESIGTVFDTQRGALMGQQINPETGNMTSITGVLLLQAALVLMIELGAFAWLFSFLVETYVLWPVTAWLPAVGEDATQTVIQHFNAMCVQYIIYALPLILTLLVIEMIFAFVGLYSPQLQVYFMAMPVKSLAGLVVLYLYGSMLWQHGTAEFLNFKLLHHSFALLFPS